MKKLFLWIFMRMPRWLAGLACIKLLFLRQSLKHVLTVQQNTYEGVSIDDGEPMRSILNSIRVASESTTPAGACGSIETDTLPKKLIDCLRRQRRGQWSESTVMFVQGNFEYIVNTIKYMCRGKEKKCDVRNVFIVVRRPERSNKCATCLSVFRVALARPSHHLSLLLSSEKCLIEIIEAWYDFRRNFSFLPSKSQLGCLSKKSANWKLFGTTPSQEDDMVKKRVRKKTSNKRFTELEN